jgi:chemotaxis protein methyltransferase CheR
VVFCRNVLIYLAREVTESFLDRLSSWLTPGGLVFLGYSETMLAPTDRLRLDRIGDTHALRVVPPGSARRKGSGRAGGSRGLGGSGALEGSAGLWTTPGAQVPGRLRSPTGGPGAEPAGSGAPREPGSATDEVEAGVVAVSRGDPREAVAAFRRAVFLEPDRAAAWFQLGLALEAVAGPRGAHRAYAAALGALERCDQDAVQAELDGWRADELAGVLRAKLGRAAGGDRA